MTPQEQAIASAADRAFEFLAEELDRLSSEHKLDSVAMMTIVNAWADFPHYYADWIQESWESWTPVDGDV